MSLASHRFGRVEFRIFLLIFSTVPPCRKQQQIFQIQPIQIDELLRTLVSKIIVLRYLIELSHQSTS